MKLKAFFISFRYFLLFFILLLFSKILFFLLWGQGIHTYSQTELFFSFLLGLRYNAQVCAYLSFIPLFLDFLIFKVPSQSIKKYLTYFLNFLFLISFFIFFVVELSHHGFYFYFRTVINELIFGLIEDDTKALLISIHKNFNLGLIILSLLLFTYFLGKWHFKWIMRARIHQSKNIIFIINFLLFAILARGTFGTFPLSTQYQALPTENPFLQDFIINGAMAFKNTIKIRKDTSNVDSYKNLFKLKNTSVKIQELANEINPKIQESFKNIGQEQIKNPILPSMVGIISESLGLSLLKYHSPSFPIASEMLNYFPQFNFQKNFIISSDNGTIGSTLATITGIPHLMGSIMLSEKFGQINLENLIMTKYFQKLGYKIHFIYGGSLEWRNLKNFLTTQGFNELHDQHKLTQYFEKDLNQKVESSEWGIHDHFVYEYAANLLKNNPRKTMILILTTSNHPPFELPKINPLFEYQLPPELKSRLRSDQSSHFIKRLKTYAYSTWATAQFLKKINLIDKNFKTDEKIHFFLCGDHNFWGPINYQDDQMVERYSIPFLTYQFQNKFVSLYPPRSHEQILNYIYEYIIKLNNLIPEQSYLKQKNTLLRYAQIGINPQIMIYQENEGNFNFLSWRKLLKNKNNKKLKLNKYQIKNLDYMGSILNEVSHELFNLKN